MTAKDNKHGPHYLAYKQCEDFAIDDTLTLVSDENPWHPKCEGWQFHALISSAQPATVKHAISLAGTALDLSACKVQRHLRWLFTWGEYIEINGRGWR